MVSAVKAILAVALSLCWLSDAFQPTLWSSRQPVVGVKRGFPMIMVSSSSDTTQRKQSKMNPSPDWELDCYSRPVVMVDGKKLWEVLVTDSTGTMRVCEALPSNK